jgi:hypothetical protein
MKKKELSLDEAVFLTFAESGEVAFKTINEMHNILRERINKG